MMGIGELVEGAGTIWVTKRAEGECFAVR